MNIYYLMKFSLLIAMIALIASGCGQQQGGQQKSTPDYRQTKQMVIDILQTEEGKKAITEIVKSPENKQKILMNEQQIKKLMEDSFNKPENTKTLQKIMADPRVAGAMAKAAEKEHKKMIKDLMKDPEYQKMMISVMKDPEFEKSLLDVMKSSAYRQQTMSVLKEALQSPMFRMEMIDLMTKAMEEMSKPEKGKQGGKEGGNKKSGGGGGDTGAGDGGSEMGGS